MKKKFLSVFLTLVMIVTALPKTVLNVQAEWVKYGINGNWRDKYGYPNEGTLSCKLNDDTKEATIIGGRNFWITAANPYSYCIPSTLSIEGTKYTVTAIGKDAFKSMKYLKTPDTLKYIEEGAFYGSEIERLDLSESINLKVIPKEAFMNCNNLYGVDLPNGLIKIDQDAFKNCLLKEVTFPETVSELGISAFENCKNLKKIDLSLAKNLKSIPEKAFSGSSPSIIKFPDSVSNISPLAFSPFTAKTWIKSINIPAGLSCTDATEFLKRLYGITIEVLTISPKIKEIDVSRFKTLDFKRLIIPHQSELSSVIGSNHIPTIEISEEADEEIKITEMFRAVAKESVSIDNTLTGISKWYCGDMFSSHKI